LKTVFAEKITAEGYDRFWLESFMEKLKHNDIVEMGKRLTDAPKDKAFDELKQYIADFEKAHEKRTKEMYQKHKDAAKVTGSFLMAKKLTPLLAKTRRRKEEEGS